MLSNLNRQAMETRIKELLDQGVLIKVGRVVFVPHWKWLYWTAKEYKVVVLKNGKISIKPTKNLANRRRSNFKAHADLFDSGLPVILGTPNKLCDEDVKTILIEGERLLQAQQQL